MLGRTDLRSATPIELHSAREAGASLRNGFHARKVNVAGIDVELQITRFQIAGGVIVMRAEFDMRGAGHEFKLGDVDALRQIIEAGMDAINGVVVEGRF